MLSQELNRDHETDRCDYSCLSSLFIGDKDETRLIHPLFSSSSCDKCTGVRTDNAGDIAKGRRS